MASMLRNLQPPVKPFVAFGANDISGRPCNQLHMSQQTRIHKDKSPVRIHYITEWADRRQLRQADIAVELDVDKSTVSRWFAGQVPSDKYIVALSSLFGLSSPSDIFRHPDDDWLAKFFNERSDAERERAIEILKAAFPPDQKRLAKQSR